MIIKSLLSSSSGNVTIVQNDTTSIMIDCGVSFKKMKKAHPEDLKLDAIVVTHEHGDHISGVGVAARKTNSPVFLHEKSYQKKKDLFDRCTVNFVDAGESFRIKDFSIHPFSTRHDSEACLGYTVLDLKTGKKFGFLTDTGVITALIKKELKSCDAIFIECDYDDETLKAYDEYDDYLKDRISGPYGHLSNAQVIDFLETEEFVKNLQWIIIGHLSKKTNSPEILNDRLINSKLEKSFIDKIHIVDDTPVELKLE